jgi:opacity protein-like surface antigen
MKLITISMLCALATMSLFAQPREGKNIELGLSGSYQNRSSGGSSESVGAFLLNPKVGFYVFEGLELEPEMSFMFYSGYNPSYVLNANVSYNFISTANSTPFLLIGYGRANAVPFFNVPSMSMDFGVNVLNLGAGTKVYLNENVAIRIEYRYQRFTGNHQNTYYSSYTFTETVDARIHTLEFGLTVLL